MRLLARLLLAVAFLLAQAAGVAHQAWHDVAPVFVHADETASHGKAPQKNVLCDFHSALSAVLGAVDGTQHAVASDVQAAIGFVLADASSTGRFTLALRSRGPPAVL